MNFPAAKQAITLARSPAFPQATVHFVSPILSAMCAAASQVETIGHRFRFYGDAGTYAINNGLAATLEGRYIAPERAGRQGVTYSPLTQLQSAAEVEACNAIVADLVYGQLGESRNASALVKVVGELHDNVASHAAGVGFSCAQVYRPQNGNKRIEFAIADAGCGMLRNVQRRVPDCTDHEDAVRWCLKKGNTSAAVNDFWAQRLPEDAWQAPFPGPVYRDEGGNHHAGLGLYHLRRLVRLFGGNLWIWSGNSQIMYTGGTQRSERSNPSTWQGVAIEFELIVPPDRPKDVQYPGTQDLDDFIRQLGLS